MQTQKIKSDLPARGIAALAGFDQFENYQDLSRIGICLDSAMVQQMASALMSSGQGMDANLTPPLSTPSVTTPIQFLQEWLTGFVHVVTAARRIDEMVGVVTQGSWEDEEIVQGIMEHTGDSRPYGDYTDIPLASWNTNFERRTVVRFEEGMQVGRLEEKRAAAIQVNSAAEKRAASALALEIIRNAIGFFGYNNGANRTYGFLNDPELPAYVTAPNGDWPNSDFLSITADIRSMARGLRVQSQDRIDPARDQITMAIATNVVDFLSVTSEFGNSVADWLRETYPNVRVVSAPELNEANGGEDVAYFYAENVNDTSTDDGRTMIQVVPAKFSTLGVEQRAKGYVEDYSNATAGVMVKRPWAVYRMTGLNADS